MGLKGKQRVIENNVDIIAMYADYKGKRIITIVDEVLLEATFISKETISFPYQSGQIIPNI